MIDTAIIEAANQLPERYAHRLTQNDHGYIVEYRDADEWEEMTSLLVASLRQNQQPVTPTERDELRTLLEAMGEPTDGLDGLNVTDQA